ncbi:hypothetical protein [Paraburkholderia sacchari]|uniref:hypothetical protein n=1 Tax=Paraburkholderia sacchari TaxID=159450 RepID=UPI003D99CAEB
MFLDSGKKIRDQIRLLLEKEVSHPARFAVAFWGASADLHLKGACRIVCDLQSGACNPQVIRKIRHHPTRVVLQLDDLHAKIVITSGGAIVSSANMSTNGLGCEGGDASGTIEAGYLIHPGTEDFRTVELWFEGIWAKARPITERDLSLAEQKWKFRNRDVSGIPEVGEVDPDQSGWPLEAHRLLKDHIDKNDRVRAVTPEVMKIAIAALPDVENRMLGKVATFACHALLCRTGTVLSYAPDGNEPGGTVTEDWIFGRFRRTGAETRERVDAVLTALAKDMAMDAPVRNAAALVLEDPRWPNPRVGVAL